MQDVTITFGKGPLRGRSFEFEVGKVVIGRQPPEDGLELKDAGVSVSRIHAELVERDGDVVLNNLSPNGTTVDDKLIVDNVKLHPGSRIDIGGQYEFEVVWQTFVATIDTRSTTKESKPIDEPGPLSSPVVRAIIGIYVLGMIGVGVWLSADDGATVASDDWPALAASYESYQSDVLPDEEFELRLQRAQELVQDLRALRTRGLNQRVEGVCREIMSIDKDSRSPLFRYGAQCLSTN